LLLKQELDDYHEYGSLVFADFSIAVPRSVESGRSCSEVHPRRIIDPDGAPSMMKSGPQTPPLTIGFDESPAGYPLASCSPAELASASPVAADSETEALV